MNIDRILEAGDVTRYHTQRTINRQTNAAHQWGVAMILLDIEGKMGVSAALMNAALLHDVGELVTGDMPYTMKKDHPDVKRVMDAVEARALEGMDVTLASLTELERQSLKMADMLELMYFCLKERRMGNTCVDHVWANGWAALERMIKAYQGHHAIPAVMLHMRYVADSRDALYPNEPSSL